MKVSEKLKKLWKHLPVTYVPTSFLILPKFHLYFHNSTETPFNLFFNKNVDVGDIPNCMRGRTFHTSCLVTNEQ